MVSKETPVASSVIKTNEVTNKAIDSEVSELLNDYAKIKAELSQILVRLERLER